MPLLFRWHITVTVSLRFFVTPHHSELAVTTELVAVLAAVSQGEPRVLTTECGRALPSGPLEHTHRSLQTGLREWVETRTHHPLGYVEQLYTFADHGRFDASGERVISVSYLGLTLEGDEQAVADVGWQDWYRYFPWEDRRQGESPLLSTVIQPQLQAWANSAQACTEQYQRWQRACYTFGFDGAAWNEDMALQRYELLFEARLIPEALRAGNAIDSLEEEGLLGLPMRFDHRRILATGVARLRAKIKYRPVVFELMPPSLPCCSFSTL